ncbi:hypothetical protein [Paraglaciecola aestuariivivens]
MRQLIITLVKLSVLFWATASVAQSHPLQQEKGLKRFNIDAVLPNQSKANPFKIREVFIGANILKQAISLYDQGGQLDHIRGGTRSDKLSFNFNQAYKHSQLKQKLALYFDKDHGFIHQVSATYTLEDAYLSIDPIRQQTLTSAIAKYGQPFTMQQAYSLTGQTQGEIKLSKFIQALEQQAQTPKSGIDYFNQRNISRSAKLMADPQDYALMHSGFDRCYLFEKQHFDQLITFCFFDQSSANPNSRGVELNLHHFSVAEQIQALDKPQTSSSISL